MFPTRRRHGFFSSSIVPAGVSGILLLTCLPVSTLAAIDDTDGCGADHGGRRCHDPLAALPLKITIIFAILVAGLVGICLPIVSRYIQPAMLDLDDDIFVITRAFSGGVILAAGFMHVLPDSLGILSSACLSGTVWGKYPFTMLVAMVAALVLFTVESSASCLNERMKDAGDAEPEEDGGKIGRHRRIITTVLELCTVSHSAVIGLSIGLSHSPCTIRSLAVAICLHQFFEGMGLGGCILKVEYKTSIKAVMVFLFCVTKPFGIALGMGLSSIYREGSPAALIVEGLLNAASAGMLNYMALVNLLAGDFMGPRLQGDLKLQLTAYMAVFVGVGSISLLAIWA